MNYGPPLPNYTPPLPEYDSPLGTYGTHYESSPVGLPDTIGTNGTIDDLVGFNEGVIEPLSVSEWDEWVEQFNDNSSPEWTPNIVDPEALLQGEDDSGYDSGPDEYGYQPPSDTLPDGF